MESVEKSEIFPPLPQPHDDGDEETERIIINIRSVENKGVQNKAKKVEKESRIRYNRAAAGKEWQSKQGSTGTCSGLTK